MCFAYVQYCFFISLGYYIGMCIAAPEKNLGYILQVGLSLSDHKL